MAIGSLMPLRGIVVDVPQVRFRYWITVDLGDGFRRFIPAWIAGDVALIRH